MQGLIQILQIFFSPECLKTLFRFNNDPCDGGNRNGTCYTSEECDDKGGTNSGSCADGYGVCCTCKIAK